MSWTDYILMVIKRAKIEAKIEEVKRVDAEFSAALKHAKRMPVFSYRYVSNPDPFFSFHLHYYNGGLL